jgi:hypothetical protein
MLFDHYDNNQDRDCFPFNYILEIKYLNKLELLFIKKVITAHQVLGLLFDFFNYEFVSYMAFFDIEVPLCFTHKIELQMLLILVLYLHLGVVLPWTYYVRRLYRMFLTYLLLLIFGPGRSFFYLKIVTFFFV